MEDKYDLISMQKTLKNHLDESRFRHTLGVMYTATALAMVHGYDLEDAQVAGLLHDCAKCISNKKKIKLCKKNKIEISSYEKENPFMLHTKVGVLMASEIYHVKDASILNAILWHTTGRPAMSVLEKIIYIADYIEPGRDRAVHLEQIRKIAFLNLDECMYMVLRDSLEYLRTTGNGIDTMSVSAYEYYSNLHNQI